MNLKNSDTFVIAGASVNTDVLDLFEVVMDILNETRRKGEGCIRGRDLWTEVSKKDHRFLSLVVPPQTGVEAVQMADAVVSVKKVMSFMSAIGDSLQERLAYLTSVQSPGWGLLSLPDEILTSIIEFAAPTEEYWPKRPALRLSHVCRKFREITLHLPGIWTGVSLEKHSPAVARLYAERSGHVGIDVNTIIDSVLDRVGAYGRSRFFQAIIPYCNEWRSFSYSDRDSDCPELYAALKLPRLEQLRVRGDNKALYSLFDMPILKSARLVDSVPPRPFSTTITLLHVKMGYRYKGLGLEKWLVPLLAFLKATPSITELGLGLECYMDSINASRIPHLTLENIGVFKLYVEYQSTEAEDNAGCLLAKSIRMPNLSTMDLMVRFTLDTPPTSRKDSYVFGLLPDPTVHHKLKSLRLNTYDARVKDELRYIKRGEPVPENLSHKATLVFDASKAPHLTSLWLRTNFDLRLTFEENKFFPLRRLELDGCPKLTNQFMEDVYLGLEHDGNWEGFEEVVIRDCPRISEDSGFLDCNSGSLFTEKLCFVPVTEESPLPDECFGLDF